MTQSSNNFSDNFLSNINPTWRGLLKDEFEKEYWRSLLQFVESEYREKPNEIFPAKDDIFRAFKTVNFDDIKVVILGQDPYHGEGEATGLAFAVPSETKLPPSLKNIFKEIESDTGTIPHKDGNLERWAKQGVLLLNATLSVRKDTPGSHQKKGWEQFTDAVIRTLNENKNGLVFILWGNYARMKGEGIDRVKHLVLESPHPSPFSARHGFFGSKHFSKTNYYLKSKGGRPIDWR